MTNDNPPERESTLYPKAETVVNHNTGEICSLQLMTDPTLLSENDITRFIEICNQPKIYDTFYRHKLHEKPVNQNWAKSYFENTTNNLTYLIRDPSGRIVATIGLKPSTEESNTAEINYLASEDYPGIMTNSIIKICEMAKIIGYKKLTADFLADNHHSQRVLERSGFTILDTAQEKNGRKFKYAEIILQ